MWPLYRIYFWCYLINTRSNVWTYIKIIIIITEAPVVLTHPHFMHAHQIYKDSVDGLRTDPNSEEHGTFIEIEPVRPLSWSK